MKLSLIVLLLLTNKVLAASIDGESGSLIYSNKEGGNYHSLVFKAKSGELVKPFDVGLNYSFDGDRLSPDKSYSIVNFSESGVLDSGRDDAAAHGLYLCAFVRMSDGCITAVESGEQCGGEWVAPNRWSSTPGSSNDSLFNEAPSIAKFYKAYLSGQRNRSRVSNPRVISYLLEGTSFQNLLACDPPNEGNKGVYGDLKVQLKRDGDIASAEAIEEAQSNIDKLQESAGVGELKNLKGWIQKSVLPEQSYLYKSPSAAAITRAYLIRGDVVFVEDKSVGSFVKLRYKRGSGEVIERWVRCEDVGSCDLVQ